MNWTVKHVTVHTDETSVNWCTYRARAHDNAIKRAVVCVHGFTGDGRDFDVLKDVGIEDIDEWWAVDVPGHGQSERPDQVMLYQSESVRHQFDQVLRYIRDQTEATELVVLGYSMGGRLVLQWLVWANRLVNVNRVVVVGASPGIEDEHARQERQAWDHDLANRIASEGVERFLAYWQDIPLLRSQSNIPEPFLSELRARRLTNDGRGLALSLRGFGSGTMPSIWDEVSQFTEVPVLYVAGALDEKYVRVGQRLAGACRVVTCVEIEGAGHTAHLEKPEAFAKAVRCWGESIQF